MALNSVHLNEHLTRQLGTAGFTVTGANATVPGNLNEAQVQNIVEAARLTGYKVTVVAGVFTLSPR